MNENIQADGAAGVPWPTSDSRLPRAPETSMLNGGATRVAQELADSVSAAEEALHEKASALQAKSDAWAESVRSTVRSNPLACLAAAIGIGAALAGLMRAPRRARDTR